MIKWIQSEQADRVDGGVEMDRVATERFCLYFCTGGGERMERNINA